MNPSLSPSMAKIGSLPSSGDYSADRLHGRREIREDVLDLAPFIFPDDLGHLCAVMRARSMAARRGVITKQGRNYK